MAWITTEDVYEKWIPAVDNNGDTLGYILPSEARKLNIRVITIEKPVKFIKDPYINYHAQLLVRSGRLTNGKDLNEVQTVVLLGYIVNEKEEETERRKIDFEQLLFANSPEMYKSYKEREEQRLLAEDPGYQQIRPKSLNELLAMFDVFGEEGSPNQGKEQKTNTGWLDDMLDEEEMSQIRD